eukprot:1702272-Rhodomonas_salina.1
MTSTPSWPADSIPQARVREHLRAPGTMRRGSDSGSKLRSTLHLEWESDTGPDDTPPAVGGGTVLGVVNARVQPSAAEVAVDYAMRTPRDDANRDRDPDQ